VRTQQYCLDGVLLGAATELEAALTTASTLDAAIEVHVAFLRAAKDKCFLTPSLLTRRYTHGPQTFDSHLPTAL
jgi:hypothetical protein